MLLQIRPHPANHALCKAPHGNLALSARRTTHSAAKRPRSIAAIHPCTSAQSCSLSPGRCPSNLASRSPPATMSVVRTFCLARYAGLYRSVLEMWASKVTSSRTQPQWASHLSNESFSPSFVRRSIILEVQANSRRLTIAILDILNIP